MCFSEDGSSAQTTVAMRVYSDGDVVLLSYALTSGVAYNSGMHTFQLFLELS